MDGTQNMPDFIDLLYNNLSKLLKSKYEILAISLEPGIENNKKKLIIYTMPTKNTCVGFLFESPLLKENVWKSNLVTLTPAHNLHIILSVLLNNYSYVPASDAYTQNAPVELESICCRSLLSFAPYGLTSTSSSSLLIDFSYLYLFFGKDTKFYSASFKTLIQENKFRLLPNKSGLIGHLGMGFNGLISKANSNDFNRNSNTRSLTYYEVYSLFTIFLVIQRYFFTGVMSLELDERQTTLLSVIKLSANPWGYIKDAIDVLVREQLMVGDSKQTPEEYQLKFKNILSTYMCQCMEIPSTQLLGEIKL